MKSNVFKIKAVLKIIGRIELLLLSACMAFLVVPLTANAEVTSIKIVDNFGWLHLTRKGGQVTGASTTPLKNNTIYLSLGEKSPILGFVYRPNGSGKVFSELQQPSGKIAPVSKSNLTNGGLNLSDLKITPHSAKDFGTYSYYKKNEHGTIIMRYNFKVVEKK